MMLGSTAWLTACGGMSTDFEGIYMVDAWNDNPTSCDAEGPSVIDQRADLFYVKLDSFLGYDFVNVNTCASIVECQEWANDEETLHIGEYGFDQGNDDDGWTTRVAFATDDPELPTNCIADVRTAVLTGDATTVSIRVETVDTPSFAREAEDCFYEEDERVFDLAEGQPCVALETIHATYQQDF
jgi:hypothetical protein